MQQRAFDREPLAHAAREAGDDLVRAILQARVGQCAGDGTVDIPHAAQAPENVRFSAAVSSG